MSAPSSSAEDEAPDNACSKDENREGTFGYVPRTESPYEILGLNRHGAYTDTQINKAYRKVSLKAHPDRPGGSVQAFNRITASYNMIKTEELRRRHKEFGQRLEPGAGEALGRTVDKLRPFMLGIAGGVLSSVGYWNHGEMIWNYQLILWTACVGSAPNVSLKVSVVDALGTSVSGMLVGGVVGTMLCGMAWSVATALNFGIK